MPRVNPAILSWARETAGFTREEAATRLGIKQARGATPVERLSALEVGEEEPSRPLIVRMAKQYRRPLLTFYLGAPPRVAARGNDFRTLPRPAEMDEEAILDALVRGVRSRQSLVRAALEEDEEIQPRVFVDSMTQRDGKAAVMTSIQQTLGFSLERFRSARSADEAFAYLRSLAESAGVFVILQGDLGSHHSALSVDTFRGFALADPIAPFIVINDQDSHSAWSFTLVHELSHIWLGETGISGGPPLQAIERFCNDVASEFLLPDSELRLIQVPSGSEPERLEAVITAFAEDRRVSRSLVAYRLYRAGRIDEGLWRHVASRFRAQWHEARDLRRAIAREQDGGPSYYVTRRHRLGPALLDVAERALRSGALPTSKVAQVLGVKPQRVGPLLEGRRESLSE